MSSVPRQEEHSRGRGPLVQRRQGRETSVLRTQVASVPGGGVEEEDVRRWERRCVLTHRSRGGVWILFSVYSGATDLIVKISAAVGVIWAGRGGKQGFLISSLITPT